MAEERKDFEENIAEEVEDTVENTVEEGDCAEAVLEEEIESDEAAEDEDIEEEMEEEPAEEGKSEHSIEGKAEHPMEGEAQHSTEGKPEFPKEEAEHHKEGKEHHKEGKAGHHKEGKEHHKESREHHKEGKAEHHKEGKAEHHKEGKAEHSREEDPEKKNGFFKKKKDKRDEQIEELNDRLRRQMAEFDNFRKRSEKEKSHMFDMGARTIIEKILPVVDNFERGFTMVEEEDRENAFVSGMDKVYKQLMTELEGMGVKVIEAQGQEFDPNFHNAVMQVESEELESGMVAQELQKGYMYKDTVVRHSMVSVVQ